MSRADDLLKVLIQTAYSEPPSDLHHGLIDKVWDEIVKPSVSLQRGARILDIGAGDGYALEIFEREGFSAMGVNFVGPDVSACVTKGLRCLHGDLHDGMPDYWGGQADLVWARHVIEHSPFPMLALSEISRVLKPEGWLYVEVPASDTDCKHEENKNHWSLFSQKGWTQILLRAGFDVLQRHILTFNTLAGDDMYFSFLCQKRAS